MGRPKRKKRKGARALVILTVILLVLLALIFFASYLKDKYTIKTVVVEGNSHYSDDEIKALVMTGDYADNSLYLSYKYKNKEITDIPFIETINVQIVSDDTVRITVYEKALAGYIEYLGRYIYFDKDGIVVESSTVKTEGIPEVVGVDFDYVVMYEPLPAKDENLFKKVLNITQLMTKYGVEIQKMYFAANGEIVLYKDEITINLGQDENLDVKMINLPSLLSKLEGKSGTLKMENYDENTERVSFEENKQTDEQ